MLPPLSNKVIFVMGNSTSICSYIGTTSRERGGRDQVMDERPKLPRPLLCLLKLNQMFLHEINELSSPTAIYSLKTPHWIKISFNVPPVIYLVVFQTIYITTFLGHYCCHHFLTGWLIMVFVSILELGLVLLVASCCRPIAFTQRLLARRVPGEPPWWLFRCKRERATMSACSQATSWEPACIWQKVAVTAIFLA